MSNSATDETKALLHLFEEIAGEAALVAEICHQACGNNGDPNLDSAAARLASRIGWLADEAVRRYGGVGARGSAQEWLLSPRMREYWTSEKAESH